MSAWRSLPDPLPAPPRRLYQWIGHTICLRTLVGLLEGIEKRSGRALEIANERAIAKLAQTSKSHEALQAQWPAEVQGAYAGFTASINAD
jgi:hypothetical protein